MDLLTRMAGEIGQLLKDKGQTVAVSETSAGGLVSAALLAVPGASAYYMGGGVLYTYDSRSILLGLPEDAFEGMRPSTEPYAAKLAAAIKRQARIDLGCFRNRGRRPLWKQIRGCARALVHGGFRPGGQGDDAGDGQRGQGGEHVGVRGSDARPAQRGNRTKLTIWR